MKKYILTGLIILLPITVTIWIGMFLFELFTTPFVGLVRFAIEQYLPNFAYHDWLLFFSRVIVLILLVMIIFLLGFLGQRFFFNWLLGTADRMMRKIPILRTVYKLTTDVTKSLLSPSSNPFKKTVLLKFPNDKATAYGFLTGDVPKEVSELEGHQDPMKSVFLPTSPHPISGFMLMYKQKDLEEIDISIENVFKILVSCGLYDPSEQKKGDQDE